MSAIPITPPPQEDEVDEILKRTGAHAIPTGQVAGAAQASPAIPTNPAPDDSSGAIPTQSHPLHQQAGVASLWAKASSIHNPVLRVLGKIGAGLARGIDVAGSVVAPEIAAAIPGSTVNTRLNEDRQRKQASEDTVNQERQATTAHTQQQTAEAPQELDIKDREQTLKEDQAQAKPDQQDLAHLHAAAVQEAIEHGQDPAKSPKVQQYADAITGLQKQPAQKQAAPPHITYDAGIPVSVTSGDKTFDVNDPNLPPELKPLVQSATRAHGQHVSEEANKTASAQAQQEKMFQEHQDALTSSTKSMIEAAPGVITLANRVKTLVDQQKASLGPAAGRWSELMAGQVGAPNPEFTKLRTDVGLLTTKLMRMHVGARGGELIMQHFKDLIDSGKQSPENMQAALDEIIQYANETKAERPSSGGQSQGGGKPAAENDPLGIR